MITSANSTKLSGKPAPIKRSACSPRLVSHELASIYAVADRVIMLDKKAKGIIAEGRPQDLRDNSKDPFVHKFFHREAA